MKTATGETPGSSSAKTTHAVETMVTFESGGAAALSTSEYAVTTAEITLLELRCSEAAGCAGIRTGVGVDLGSLIEPGTANACAAWPRSTAELFPQTLVRVGNTETMTGIVSPWFSGMEATSVEITEAITVKEMIIDKDVAAKPIGSPAPPSPAAAVAKE
jgi:hypothetical protein